MKLIYYNPKTTNSTPIVRFEFVGIKVNYEIKDGSRKTKRMAL
jgi:hypothetical protein